MGAEAKRGCGFRKIGGLYLVSEGPGLACDRLPILLDVCPCCGTGIKPTRSWAWIQPIKLLAGDHLVQPKPCYCLTGCPACNPTVHFSIDGKAGLLWVGEAFYKTPQDFPAESSQLGLSRRISAIPKGFKVGETWVFFAHRKAIKVQVPSEGLFAGQQECDLAPGIFSAIRPQRIERIVKRSEYDHHQKLVREFFKANTYAKLYDVVPETDEVFWRLQRDVERNITLVPVPDDDPDHQP